MKHFGYTAIRDAESQERSYWQVWVYDSRADGGLRLVEARHHTKERAHTLADLLNHEMREFIAYNNGDVAQKRPPSTEPVLEPPQPPANTRPSFWSRLANFFSKRGRPKNEA